MNTRFSHSVATCSIVCCGFLSASALGVVITIDPVETPNCDPLVLPNVVHELGNPPVFPVDELIESISTFTNLSACLPDNPAVPNRLVIMTNLTMTDWMDVHYVGDARPGVLETFFTNDDGLVTGGLAFRIDTIGANTPLVFESMTPDGIFEAGETWEFIVQDYGNVFGLPPHAFGSVAAVGFGSGGDPVSSASIIANPVPAPGAIALLTLGGLITFSRRRR